MIDTGDLEHVDLFALLSPAMRARIASRAADVRLKPGDWLVREGDPAHFWVVLEGEVEVIRTIGGVDYQTTTFEPGEFFGEVPLMLGASAISSVRALSPSRLARIEPVDFHALVLDSEDAGALIAQTVVRRVNAISGYTKETQVTQATIVGDQYDVECHAIRDFLSRNHITFDWLDPSNPADAELIPQGVEGDRCPAVVLADGTVLEHPTTQELARRLHLQTEPGEGLYDVAVIGGGPAGLAAGVYGGSEGLRTILIEREAPGGQAGTSSRIENYLGFPSGISGDELANRALSQAKRFGTELLVTRSVERIESRNGEHAIVLDGGAEVRAQAVVVATGVSWRRLSAEGADRLVGRGVYYGAARTEAFNTRGKDVYLIGGGNSAGQAAMFFSNYARSVTILVRSHGLESSMSHYLIAQIADKANITVESRTSVVAVHGEHRLERIATVNHDTDERRERPADALFVFIGADADTAWLPAAIERDARGFVRTGRDVGVWSAERSPYFLETSVPGIFAAGDVRSNSIKRVASGVGEGSMVIAFIHQHLASPEPAAATPAR